MITFESNMERHEKHLPFPAVRKAMDEARKSRLKDGCPSCGGKASFVGGLYYEGWECERGHYELTNVKNGEVHADLTDPDQKGWQ